MPALERITIPVQLLDDGHQIDVVRRIAAELSRLSLDPRRFLFCGVEGADLIEATESSHLEPRESTFATDWEFMIGQAGVYDKYPGADHENPITFAKNAEQLPAILVYDKDELHDEYLHEWRSKNNRSVSNAARAIIFFM